MQQLIFILFLSLWVTVVTAQPITSNSFEQKVKAAEYAESVFNYAGALDWYDQAYDDLRERGQRGDPQVKAFALKIADLSYKIRDYEKANKTYSRVLKNDRDQLYSEYRYDYALSLKAMAEYSLALEEFNKFISLSEDEDKIKKAEFEIAGIESLRGLESNVETAIKPLEKAVNSASAEFSPRLNSEDRSLYFGSFNRSKQIEVDSEDDDFHAKIFMSAINDKGGYSKKEELDEKINRKGFHNTNLAFSRDGKTMYFTRIQTEGTEILNSRLMVSYKKDIGWSAADEVTGINGEHFIKHPAVGQLFGRDVIFFASDMEGGHGGLDIYYANFLGEGNFSTPVNLGAVINTAGDDICPSYHDGSLYYSTNGKPTIGGYDIFRSSWDGSDWSESANIGLGYNSAQDDLYMSFNDDGSSGYLVSNRPTENKKRLKSKTCCDDIFQFNIKQVVIDLLATVVDDSDTPLNGATIKLENLSNPIEFPIDSKFNSLGNEFQFLLDSDYEYKAVITSDGFYPDSITFNTAGIIDDYTVKKKIALQPIPKEPEITEEVEIVSINQPIRLNNIYYDFDDYKILQDAEKDLSTLYDLLNKYPDMVIELSSHTDAQGVSKYNEKLSQQRAESATNWLLDKGIAPERIKPVGYGESVILNRCTNGVRCTDDEHRVNRRTEFKIIAGPQTIEIKKEVLRKVIK